MTSAELRKLADDMGVYQGDGAVWEDAVEKVLNAAGTIDALQAENERLMESIDLFEAMKDGVAIRISDIESERDALRANVACLKAGLEHCQQLAGPDSCAAMALENETLRKRFTELGQEVNRYRAVLASIAAQDADTYSTYYAFTGWAQDAARKVLEKVQSRARTIMR